MRDPKAADQPLEIVIPEVDESAVAVLLLDPVTGRVTFASPPALALAGDRAPLPATVDSWSRAAGLGPVPGAAAWSDPVLHVAAGGSVSGWRVAFTAPDGEQQIYWATGAQLISTSGASHGAMVAFFPVRHAGVHLPDEPPADAGAAAQDSARDAAMDDAVDAAVDAALLAAEATAAGPHGAVRVPSAGTRAPAAPRAPVARPATIGGTAAQDVAAEARVVRETADDAATLMTDGALTARALLASSISFTISDPKEPDNPLIWVNPAFERTTGYRMDEVVGHNCRFLQGPGTDRAEVDRIRTALQAGEAVGSELLNYRADGTAFWNALAISPVLDGEGRLTHFVGVQADVTARVLAGVEHDRLLAAEREARAAAERARAQLALIEQVGAMLSETLDSEEALQRVVTAVVPELGDFCAVDVVEPVAELVEAAGSAVAAGAVADRAPVPRTRRVAVAHRDPAKEQLYWRLGELDRLRAGSSYIPAMLRTGRSLLVPPMTDDDYLARSGGDPEALDLIRRLDVSSGAVVPLRARGRVIAVLSIGMDRSRGRDFGPEDLALAESLAARAALAVDNARLFEAESGQRRRADALAAAGQALAGSLRSTDVVGVLLEQVVPAFADWAFVHVDTTASPSLRPASSAPGLHPAASRHADAQREAVGAALLQQWHVTADHPGPGRAWGTSTAQLLPDLRAALAGTPAVRAGYRDAMRDLGVTSAVSVPLTARGVTGGALTVCRHGGRPFTAEELEFVTELGRRGALALENARLYETQRVVALELQRSLLPDRLPVVPELDVAGRYLAGAAGTEVGGDWYDVVQLPDGRLMVAVGDVMGRGVRAAAVMGQMRSALRSYAVEGLGPADVLDRLAAFTGVLEGEHFITCVVGLFDAASGVVELATAGHPPPLVLAPDGATRFADVDPGLPLGVVTGRVGALYTSTDVNLPPGAGLVLYTDGLVEDRDVSVGAGLDRLREGMRGLEPDSADDICDVALQVMGRLDSHDDDTAVLALRVPPGVVAATGGLPVVQVRMVLQDEGTGCAATSRRAVREALTRHGLTALVDPAVLLVSEVVTNALRHGGGAQELTVDVDAGGVTISVSDSSPSPPLQRDRWDTVSGMLPEDGRGLMLVATLADDWGWVQEPSGKRVWFRLRSRPDGAAAHPAGSGRSTARA